MAQTKTTTKKTKYMLVEPEVLLGETFTIKRIKKQDLLNNAYKDYEWCIYIETVTGKFYWFTMNPTKTRDKQLMKLQEELPKTNMQVTEEEFYNQKTRKNISYYSLEECGLDEDDTDDWETDDD